MPAPGNRVVSDQRRRDVLQSAVTCFAWRGFYGTTTHEIAKQAGISQPYLYRLFANKEELFVGAVDVVSEMIEDALVTHAAATSPLPDSVTGRLQAARAAYGALIGDRDVLRFLMHANCAADEPLVGDAVRRCYAKQVRLVGETFGFDDTATRQWFAAGMLENVVTALHLDDIDEPWARTMSGRSTDSAVN
jgi:AcrR family transcriptional regulator